MSLSSFSVRRRVAVTMFFLGVAVIGLVSFTKLSLDMFPDIEPPVVTVIMPWMGASATDIEQKVTENLEDRLSALPDLDDMVSVSQDNLAVVQLTFDWGTDLHEATNNIRALVGFAKRFMPDEVEDAMIYRMNMSQIPILMLGVTSAEGDVQAYSELIEERVSNELARVDGVASVIIFNQRLKQVLVEVDSERLEAHNLSLAELSAAIQSSNLTLPAGTMDIGRSQYTLRVPGEFDSLEDVRDVVVGQSRTSGAPVHLRDVATVSMGLEDELGRSTLDGQNMLMMMLQRESGANTVDVAQAAIARVNALKRELPDELDVDVILDLSETVVLMVDSLTNAVYGGAVLVILVVVLFLRRLRTSLVVVVSIPLSLIGVFAMLAAADLTLNMITLGAMAIAAGMVVDNSIVVLDNIVRHRESGKDAACAASDGASEVSGAVSASTLTTVSIFMPVLFVSGIIGIVFEELSYVVIMSIVASLLVSLMFVPVLTSRLLGEGEERKGKIHRWSERQFTRVEGAYGAVISFALRHRKKVVVLTLAIFGFGFFLIKIIGMDFMPMMDGGTVQVKAELPIGTNVDRTAEVAGRIREIIKKEIPESTMTFLRVGATRSGMAAIMGERTGSNIATVGCRVPKLSERDRSTFEMADAVRPIVEKIPDLVSVEVNGANPISQLGSTSGGKPLTVEVFADDIAELRSAAIKVKEIMAAIPGAVDVVTDLMDDNPEIRLDIDRKRAARLGVPMAAAASEVRTAMYGSAVTRYRGGEDDIDLFVRLRENQRAGEKDIERLSVPSVTGEQVRLASFARVKDARSPLEVRRMDQQRMLRVMGGLSGRPLGDVAKELEQKIAAARAAGEISNSVAIRFGGDIKEQRDMVVDLSLALLLSILLVYMVMAGQFESLLDPLVVMFSVPFGITGVFLALPLTGVTLSLTSFIGMIMLVGIVVNNAIVLVDYINQLRDRGMSLTEAIRTGGERRLRPVLMTALTTIGGMLPLALGSGEGAEMWRPLAVAVIGGLLFSTLVTLVLIPTVYALTDRWRKRGRAAM
jgi:HAE1 family hydrophobic/amphiphilic exporter-1